MEYRFTKFQLEKIDEKCQDYVVLKLNGFETEKLCGSRDENEPGLWKPTFSSNIELIFSTDLSVNKRKSFESGIPDPDIGRMIQFLCRGFHFCLDKLQTEDSGFNGVQ